ncbi:hypothetical protein [Variovorax rhizosphaerae]|uniref:Uncharacterized protein n=1 Tax=Variovorax rhizosphaerae TaxID=1836200 RepID=A0ABU8WGG9_9BURK
MRRLKAAAPHILLACALLLGTTQADAYIREVMIKHKFKDSWGQTCTFYTSLTISDTGVQSATVLLLDCSYFNASIPDKGPARLEGAQAEAMAKKYIPEAEYRALMAKVNREALAASAAARAESMPTRELHAPSAKMRQPDRYLPCKEGERPPCDRPALVVPGTGRQ